MEFGIQDLMLARPLAPELGVGSYIGTDSGFQPAGAVTGLDSAHLRDELFFALSNGYGLKATCIMMQPTQSPSSKSPIFRSLWALLWCIVFFAGGIGVILCSAHDIAKNPFYLSILYPIVGLIALSFLKIVRRMPGAPMAVRVTFWVATLIVSWIAGSYVAATWEAVRRTFHANTAFYCTLLIMALSLGFFWMRRNRETRFYFLRQLCDLSLGFAVIGLVLVSLIGLVHFEAERHERIAAERWAALGYPIEKLDQSVAKMEENDSLRNLASNLLPLKAQVYKQRDGQPAKEPDRLTGPMELYDLIKQGEENVRSVASVTKFFAERRPELDQLYDSVLQCDPPVWGLDTKEWAEMDVPNFLMVRKLAQVMNADALQAIREGDDAKAAKILSAGLRINSGLRQNPLLVSQMISVAVDSLLIGSYARIQDHQLPDYDTLSGQNMDSIRDGLTKAYCAEAWYCGHGIERATQWGGEGAAQLANFQVNTKLPNAWRFNGTTALRYLPCWVTRPLIRLDQANALICTAEHVQAIKAGKDLSGFSASKADTFWEQYPSYVAPNYSRATLRATASILLREQAGLIRRFRQEVKEGAARIQEVESKVLGGHKWICFIDPERRSVKTLLQNLPKDITDVAPNEFFLIPPDGTKEWVYAGERSKADTASETALR